MESSESEDSLDFSSAAMFFTAPLSPPSPYLLDAYSTFAFLVFSAISTGRLVETVLAYPLTLPVAVAAAIVAAAALVLTVSAAAPAATGVSAAVADLVPSCPRTLFVCLVGS